MRQPGAGQGGEYEYLFGIEIHNIARHVLCQGKDLHFFADCGLHHFLQCSFGMAAKLTAVTVMREGHFDVICSALTLPKHEIIMQFLR